MKLWPMFSQLMTLFGYSPHNVHDNPVTVSVPLDIHGNYFRGSINNRNEMKLYLPNMYLGHSVHAFLRVVALVLSIACIMTMSSFLHLVRFDNCGIVGTIVYGIVQMLLIYLCLLCVFKIGCICIPVEMVDSWRNLQIVSVSDKQQQRYMHRMANASKSTSLSVTSMSVCSDEDETHGICKVRSVRTSAFEDDLIMRSRFK